MGAEDKMPHSTPSTARNKMDNARLHVTLRQGPATIVAGQKQQVLYILSVCL